MPALQPIAVVPVTGLEDGGVSSPPPSTTPAVSVVPRGYPHVALYDTLTAVGGVPLQRLTTQLTEWRERHAIEDGLVTHQWTGGLPSSAPEAESILPGVVIRVARAADDIREYVVDQVSDGLGGAGLTTITALGPEYLLATVALVTATEFSGTAGGAITALLGATDPAIPWLILGEAPSTAVLDATPIAAGSSLGTALRAVAAAVAARENQPHEIRIRRLDDATMAVDILPVAAELEAVDLPYGVALTGLTRSRRGAKRATRLVDPTALLDGAFYRVTAVTSGSLDVRAMAAGLGPAIEAGQWDGFAVLGPTGVLHPILGTAVMDAATTRFTVANTSDLTVDSLVQLRRGDGSAITEVPLPSAAASSPFPIVRPVSSGGGPATNFARNAAFADWTGDVPDQWTVLGGSSGARKSTALGTWQTGGASARIPGVPGLNQGGVRQSVPVRTAGPVMLHVWARFFVISGLSEHLQVLAPWLTAAFFGDPDFVMLTVPHVPVGSWGTVFWTVGPVNSFARDPGISWETRFGGSGVDGNGPEVQPCHHYLDAVMIAVTPVGIPLPEAFEAGSGPSRAIEGINLAFAAAQQGDVTYAVRPLDLARTDPRGAGRFRALTLGALARVRGREAGVQINDTVRAVEYVEPGTNPDDLSLTLASRPPRLADALARTI